MNFSVEKTAWGDQLDDSCQLNLVYRVFLRVDLSELGRAVCLVCLGARDLNVRQTNQTLLTWNDTWSFRLKCQRQDFREHLYFYNTNHDMTPVVTWSPEHDLYPSI